MNIHLCTNVVENFIHYTQHKKSRHSNKTHVRLPGYTASGNFKDFLNTTTEEEDFNDDGNLFQSELPLN